jgi:hypothetical protein
MSKKGHYNGIMHNENLIKIELKKFEIGVA